jgi:hypothetical protein
MVSPKNYRFGGGLPAAIAQWVSRTAFWAFVLVLTPANGHKLELPPVSSSAFDVLVD